VASESCLPPYLNCLQSTASLTTEEIAMIHVHASDMLPLHHGNQREEKYLISFQSGWSYTSRFQEFFWGFRGWKWNCGNICSMSVFSKDHLLYLTNLPVKWQPVKTSARFKKSRGLKSESSTQKPQRLFDLQTTGLKYFSPLSLC